MGNLMEAKDGVRMEERLEERRARDRVEEEEWVCGKLG